MSIAGVVVAAGSGDRFGEPKHAITIKGVPMWELARAALVDGGVDDVVVVGDVPGGVRGGARRQDSVAAGLAALGDVAWVLVHDAARPLADRDLVRRVIGRLLEGDVDGVVPVVPVRDTIKRVRGSKVVETIDRSDLASVQTPQGFRGDVLRKAHRTVTDEVTDDARMVELIGGIVATVAGSPANVKVTYPADLALAEALAP